MRFGSFPEWLAEVRAVRASHLDLTADVERAQQTPRRRLIHKANSTPSRGPNVVARGAQVARRVGFSFNFFDFRDTHGKCSQPRYDALVWLSFSFSFSLLGSRPGVCRNWRPVSAFLLCPCPCP